jgi:hypothetical protein
MNKQQKLIFEQMEEMNPDAMQLDGFEDCVAGISVGFKGSCLIYDMRKVIEKLKEDMTEEEAWEYFDYNILGSWVGEFTPMFLAEINPSPED